ncbi:NAD-dependent malic enzyme, partial [Streptomyces tendae]
MAAEIVNPRSDSSTDHEGPAGAAEPFDPAFALHRGGKMAVQATVPVRDKDDLSLAYTPGVA